MLLAVLTGWDGGWPRGTRQGSTEEGECYPICGAVGGVTEHPSMLGAARGVRGTSASSLDSEIASFHSEIR